MTSTIIYALSDPRTSLVRYIGKTINSPEFRLKQHLIDKTKSHKVSWIKSLTAAGLQPVISIVEECETDWQEREIFWIAHYGEQLTNLTSGGESGWTHKQETIEKLRELGKNISDETRAKRSASLIGRVMNDASRAKMSRSATARVRQPMSQETKDKIAAKAVGNKRASYKRSPETRARMSAAQLISCKTRKRRAVA